MPQTALGTTAGRFTSRRAVALTVALCLLVPASAAWNNNVASPATGIFSTLLTGALLVIAALVACAADEQRVSELEPVLLAAGLVTLLVDSATLVPSTPNYLTADSGLLHAAAISLQHGRDPYAANLGWAIHAFRFPPIFTTGGSVWALYGHPSLPLLATFALVVARGDIPAATYVEVISLALTTLILYRALPDRLRALAPLVVVALPALPNDGLGGATETLLLPTLIVVAHGWRDVGRGGALSRRDLLRALSLGLAASTNQLAWLMIPFLLTGMTLVRLPELGLRGAVRIAGRYASLAALVFLLLNGPFIAWNPSSWFHDTLSWFAGSVVPSPQGLAGILALFAHIGGGNLPAFGWTVALAIAGVLGLYALRFRRLHNLWCVLPCLCLWLGARASIGDLIVPGVVVLVATLQGGDTSAGCAPWETGRRPAATRLLAAAALAPAAVALIIALAAPAPLEIRLLSVSASGRPGYVGEITIAVRNRSHSTLRPHFQTSDGSTFSGFWTARSGPDALAPGASATYLLSFAGDRAGPQAGSPFEIDATTSDPETVSSDRVSAAH